MPAEESADGGCLLLDSVVAVVIVIKKRAFLDTKDTKYRWPIAGLPVSNPVGHPYVYWTVWITRSLGHRSIEVAHRI